MSVFLIFKNKKNIKKWFSFKKLDKYNTILDYKTYKENLITIPIFYFKIYTHSKKEGDKYSSINYSNNITFKSFHTTNNIFIIDTFKTKKLLFKNKYSFNSYLFYKNNILLDTYLTSLDFFHKTKFVRTFIPSEHYNIVHFNNRLKKIFNYYLKWNKLQRKKIISHNNVQDIKENNNIIEDDNITDITSSLIEIESIFEATETISASDKLVFNSINIITSLCTYKTPVYYSGKHKHTINFMELINCNTSFIHEESDNHDEQNKVFYENISSIVSPNNIALGTTCSISAVLDSLYLTKLNYYNQHISYVSTNLFIYNALIESLLTQYLKQGIIIPSIHFELIAKKMTSFAKINHPSESVFVSGDILEATKIFVINNIFKYLGYEEILYSPIIVGITKSSLCYAGGLTSISFRDLFNNIIKLGLKGITIDWLTDIKSNLITSNLIKTGSGWYRHFIKI